MKSHALPIVAAAALMFASAIPAVAAPANTNGPNDHSLPVLVTVDSQGKVTDVDPAVRLSSDMLKQLKSTLDQMITKPAYKDGKPVRSQMALVLSTQTTKLDNGSYAMQFGYVSAKPVPPGHWAWHYDAHRNSYSLINTTNVSATMQASQNLNTQAKMKTLRVNQRLRAAAAARARKGS